MSDDALKHGSLPEALLAFQSEAPKLFKGSTAKVKMKAGGEYSYKYIALDDVMTIIQPLLTKHKLVFTSAPGFGANGHASLDYRLIHSGTGEEIAGSMPLMEKQQDPQALGGAITYMRRYALTAVLNLVADDDDDAQRASAPAAPASQHQPSVEKLASGDQRRLVFKKAKEAGIPSAVLANIMKIAAGGEATLFETDAEADEWLERAILRLPARLVNPIVENIMAEKVPA